jgi:hypothetical protein
MDGEKPSKIKTIKLNRLLETNKNKSFWLKIKSLFRIVQNKLVVLAQIGY